MTTRTPTASGFNTIREQLARLLAKENIRVIQDPKAPSAYFDLKNRTLALPVWKGMTDAQYDMLIGHEVGHALFTPNGNGGWVETAKAMAAAAGFAGNREAEQAATGIINIVEDARIERLVKEMYPGLRRDFAQAYSEFWANDTFEIRKNGIQIKSLGLADRLNLHFKVGHLEPVPFTASERTFVTRMEGATTWADAVAVARDLFTFSQSQSQKPEPGEGEEGEEGEGEGEGDGGKGEGNATGSGSGSGKDTAPGTSGSGDAEGTDGEGEDEGEDGKGKAQGQGKGEGDGGGDEAATNRPGQKTQADNHKPMNGPPQAPVTSDALDRTQKQSVDTRATARTYVTLAPDLDPVKNIIPYSEFLRMNAIWESSSTSLDHQNSLKAVEKMVADIVDDTKDSVQSFAREFEMRKTADEHRRTVESKSGRLDMDSAWKYRISDNLFKTATTMRDGKNHGFVLFIDWSGSMSSNMEQTMRQLFMLFQFCKKVGVPFDVYAFGFGMQETQGKAYGMEKYQAAVEYQKAAKGECLIQPQTRLLQILSSRMTVGELKKAFGYALGNCLGYTSDWHNPAPFGLGGSTPLDSCLVLASRIVPEFKAAHKLQIVNTVVLTDGEATDHVLSYANPGATWNSVTVLRDNWREYVKDSNNYNGDTEVLLGWLNDKVGGNIIGIFVTGSVKYANRYLGSDPVKVEEAQKAFKKQGWCSTTQAGFSEYFIISGGVRDTDAEMEKFDAVTGASKTSTQIRNDYIKAVSSRNSTRGMIQRFVTLVA